MADVYARVNPAFLTVLLALLDLSHLYCFSHIDIFPVQTKLNQSSWAA